MGVLGSRRAGEEPPWEEAVQSQTIPQLRYVNDQKSRSHRR